MATEATIRGYRILGENKPDRELSYEYLKLKAPAAHALNNLRASVAKDGANCVGREDEFSGATLMTDGEAQLACAGCPSFEECDLFRLLGRPAYGTFAGRVNGRELEGLDDIHSE